MQGEDPEEEDEEDAEEEDEEEEAPRFFKRREELQPPEELDPEGSFGVQPALNKIAILLAGPFMNVICCLFLCVIVYISQGNNVLLSVRAAFAATGYIIVIIKESFVQLFTGVVGLENVSGIVGIAGAIHEQAQYGLANVVYFMAVISVNLGIVNLLPFPALDGGRILLTVINRITGNKISPQVEGWINAIGMVLLMILMVVLLFKDTIGLLR